MSAIDPEHLKRTLAHPLLESIFTDFCGNDSVTARALQFWNEVNELQCVVDEKWLRIKATSLFQDYIADKKLEVSEPVYSQIQLQIEQGHFTTTMFEAAQIEIFNNPLSQSLRKFLQSEIYHKQYENLRQGSVFVCLCDCTGLQAARGQIYCTITCKETIVTSSLTSPQANKWNEEGETYRIDVIPNKQTKIIVAIYLQNQSCWQGDDLIGTTTITMGDIWDEIPRKNWYEVNVPSDQFSVRLELGVVLMHHPSIGACVTKLDFSNPLATCSGNGHFNAVKKLLAEGYPIDDHVEGTNRTALQVAIMKHRSSIAQLLLYEKADPNLVDSHSQTALHLAAQFAPNLCHMLVTSGARLEIKELFNNGQTALHMLAAYNYSDALQYLIESKANINAQTMDGTTPLHKAISNYSVAAVKILIKSGANIQLADEKGVTPVALAGQLQKSIRGKEIFKFIRDFKLSKKPPPLAAPPRKV